MFSIVGMSELRTPSPPAVDRALAILEEVAQSKRGLRLPELSLRLGLPKSSTHSLLVALERQGYLQRNRATRRYMFGPKVFLLANLALDGTTLRQIAYPALRNLMQRTDLTVNMAVLDRDQAVLVEQLGPPLTPAPMNWLGKRIDLHCTALGKVLAAFQPQESWKRFITEHTLTKHNDNTICTPKSFLCELGLTRERGFAVDNEELDLGIRCLAAPVFDPPSETIAAISISGRTSEIHEGNMEDRVQLLTAAASSITQHLKAQRT
jgi:DNA-binding IclR family transcriptional regulator